MDILKKLNYIFTKGQKIKLIFLFFMIILGTFAELFGVTSILPIIQLAVDPIQAQNDKVINLCSQIFGCVTTAELMFCLALTVLIIVCLKNVYIIFMYTVQYRFIYNNQRLLASRLMKAYMEKPYTFHLSKNSSELQRNINVDTNQFFAVVLNALQIIIDVLLILVLFIYLLYKDITMTLVSMTFVLAFMAIFYKWSRKRVRSCGEEGHDAYAKMVQYISQAFDGIKEIKVMGKESFFKKAYTDVCTRYIEANKKQSIYNAIPKYLLESVAIGGIMLVIMIKVAMGSDMAALVGNLSAFAVAIFKLVPSANRINGSINGVLFQLPSVDTIYNDLHEIQDTEIKGEGSSEELQKITFDEKLEVRELSYRYPDVQDYVLENVNITIPKGSAVAFVGESGSGKTTLADIILGVLKPVAGSILADGKSIYGNMEMWQKKLGYIPQNIFLLDDTIRNNIVFGIEEHEINEQALWRAIKQARLENYILGLEHGIDTVVGERGIRMSGGQRQRLGIARALYHDPELLVMDEATSALDQETEQAVMDSIEALYGTKTLLIIAHRRSTIEKCDITYEVANKTVQKI